MFRSAILAGSAVLVAFALISTASAPAQAQQAAAYTNPFDSASDVSNWSYIDGYPFIFEVDSSPAGGISGASLNFNDGTGIDSDWCYSYGESGDIDVSGLDSPVVSFWCRADLGSTSAFYQYRELYLIDAPNWNYYQYYSMGDSGFDIDCGTDGEWHQHLLALNPDLVASGNLHFYMYIYLEPYYQAAGLEGWFIDNLQVLVPDVTPPDAIGDLAAANPTLDTADVSWSSPADDDVSGVTASFDLRVSTTPITDANFASATAVVGEPAPDVAGTVHQITLTGLTNNTTYHFAVKTTDIAGNVSAISNLPSVTTLAPPPPPPATGGGSKAVTPEEIDTILPCSAGMTASSMGLLVLAGLIALAAACRALRRGV
jgi:hypothetical protein